jgi:transposase InsO family protein
MYAAPTSARRASVEESISSRQRTTSPSTQPKPKPPKKDTSSLSFDEFLQQHTNDVRKLHTLPLERHDYLISALRRPHIVKDKSSADSQLRQWAGSQLKKNEFMIVNIDSGNGRSARTAIAKVPMNHRGTTVNTSDLCIAVPEEDIKRRLDELHLEKGHCGEGKMWDEVKRRFCFIPRDFVRAFTQRCRQCQEFKKAKYPKLRNAVVYQKMFDVQQMDFMDFSHQPDGIYKYVLHIKDHCSKMHFTECTQTKAADEVISFLRKVWAITAPPIHLQTDNGGEFVNHQVDELCARLKVKLFHSPPYDPQSNGGIERANGTFKDYVEKYNRQYSSLGFVVAAYDVTMIMNTTYHSAIKSTPYEYVFNMKPPNRSFQILPTINVDASFIQPAPLSASQNADQSTRSAIIASSDDINDSQNINAHSAIIDSNTASIVNSVTPGVDDDMDDFADPPSFSLNERRVFSDDVTDSSDGDRLEEDEDIEALPSGVIDNLGTSAAEELNVGGCKFMRMGVIVKCNLFAAIITCMTGAPCTDEIGLAKRQELLNILLERRWTQDDYDRVTHRISERKVDLLTRFMLHLGDINEPLGMEIFPIMSSVYNLAIYVVDAHTTHTTTRSGQKKVDFRLSAQLQSHTDLPVRIDTANTIGVYHSRMTQITEGLLSNDEYTTGYYESLVYIDNDDTLSLLWRYDYRAAELLHSMHMREVRYRHYVHQAELMDAAFARNKPPKKLVVGEVVGVLIGAQLKKKFKPTHHYCPTNFPSVIVKVIIGKHNRERYIVMTSLGCVVNQQFTVDRLVQLQGRASDSVYRLLDLSKWEQAQKISMKEAYLSIYPPDKSSSVPAATTVPASQTMSSNTTRDAQTTPTEMRSSTTTAKTSRTTRTRQPNQLLLTPKQRQSRVQPRPMTKTFTSDAPAQQPSQPNNQSVPYSPVTAPTEIHNTRSAALVNNERLRDAIEISVSTSGKRQLVRIDSESAPSAKRPKLSVQWLTELGDVISTAQYEEINKFWRSNENMAELLRRWRITHPANPNSLTNNVNSE